MAVPPHSALRPLESRIWRAVMQAAETQARTIEVDAATSPVRGAFLAWLLAEGAAKAAPLLVQLTLSGAVIEAPFDLRGLRLTLTPRFVGCKLPSVDLRDATIVGFEVLAGTVTNVSADRLSTTGSLAIRETTDRDTVPERYRGKPAIDRQLRLNGATVRGNLDLRGCVIRGESQDDGVALFADGVAVVGNALLGDGFASQGEVRVSGGHFERNLDLSGAALQARATYSLSAIGTHVAGSLYLCDTRAVREHAPAVRFVSVGAIQLIGAQIDGEFSCVRGRFTAPALAEPPTATEGSDATRSIRANGIRVGGPVRLRDDFHARGTVHLVNARVGGDLQFHGAFLDYSGKIALEADGIAVTGTTFFDVQKRPLPAVPPAIAAPTERPARTNGFITLRYANFAQGLYFEGMRFESAAASFNCGILAAFARISGSLSFVDIACEPEALPPEARFVVDLRRAKADEIADDRSWTRVKSLNVTGFEYGAIRRLKPDDLWRCDVLDAQYAGTRVETAEARAMRFEPQPYLHLAKIMQQSGYGAAATQIRIRLEVAQTRAGDFGFWRRLWRHFLWLSTRYGYAPIHTVWLLLAWTLLSGWVFACATIGPEGQIVDVKAEKSAPLSMAASADRDFHPFLLALDTILPIVDLRQKSRFEIKPPSVAAWNEVWHEARGGGTHIGRAFLQLLVPLLGFCNVFIGWTLGGVFAAGVTGYLRRPDSANDG